MISMIHYFNIKLTDYQSKSKYCLWTIRLWLKPVHTDKYEKPYFGIDLDFEILWINQIIKMFENKHKRISELFINQSAI